MLAYDVKLNAVWDIVYFAIVCNSILYFAYILCISLVHYNVL